jgi:hypothetical protein
MSFTYLKQADPAKQCGECNACCTLLTIETPESELIQIHKSTVELCSHWKDGCAVYDCRPAVCRDYECLWRMLPMLRMEERPDKVGVMIASTDPEASFQKVTGMPLIAAYGLRSGVFKEYAADKMLKRLARHMPIALLEAVKPGEKWNLTTNVQFLGRPQFMVVINKFIESWRKYGKGEERIVRS